MKYGEKIFAAITCSLILTACSTPVGEVNVKVISPLQDCTGASSGDIIKEKCSDGADVYLLPKTSTSQFIKMQSYPSVEGMEFPEIPLNSCREGCRFELICYQGKKQTLRGISNVFIIDKDMAEEGTPAEVSILLSPIDGLSPIPDPENNLSCLYSKSGSSPLVGFGAASVELDDGKVLVMGGLKAPAAGQTLSPDFTKEVTLKTGFIIDPSNGALEAVEMRTPRAFHTMTKLVNGQVLIAGGYGGVNTDTVKTAEVFDPAKKKVISATFVLQEARDGHEALLLDDGKVLLIGGRKVTESGEQIEYLRSSEIFDPATQKFITGPQLNFARAFFSAIMMNKNRIVVVGGRQEGMVVKEIEFVAYNSKLAPPSAFEVDFPPENSAQQLDYGRFALGATHSTDNSVFAKDSKGKSLAADRHEKILVVGGYTGVFDTGENSSNSRKTITNQIEMVNWPYPSSSGYVYTSIQSCGKLPNNNALARAQVTPLLVLSVESETPIYGDALITGGWNQTFEPLDTAFIYRFMKDDGTTPNQCTTDPVEATQKMSIPRVGHTSVLLHDGRVLVAGGYTKTAGSDNWAVATTIDMFTPQPPK